MIITHRETATKKDTDIPVNMYIIIIFNKAKGSEELETVSLVCCDNANQYVVGMFVRD